MVYKSYKAPKTFCWKISPYYKFSWETLQWRWKASVVVSTASDCLETGLNINLSLLCDVAQRIAPLHKHFLLLHLTHFLFTDIFLLNLCSQGPNTAPGRPRTTAPGPFPLLVHIFPSVAAVVKHMESEGSKEKENTAKNGHEKEHQTVLWPRCETDIGCND